MFFLEQPAGALPIHIEEGKNHTVQERHVQINVLTCQSHQEIKMKSKSNQDRPEWQAHIP
jgi:hypothetical protein